MVLVDRFCRSGIDVDEVCACADFNDFWEAGIGTSGEYIDRGAELSNVAAKFSNVNVHAACVFAAKRGER